MAITGSRQTPDLWEIMQVLGQDCSLGRLQRFASCFCGLIGDMKCSSWSVFVSFVGLCAAPFFVAAEPVPTLSVDSLAPGIERQFIASLLKPTADDGR